jgi:hypothetical protein
MMTKEKRIRWEWEMQVTVQEVELLEVGIVGSSFSAYRIGKHVGFKICFIHIQQAVCKYLLKN